MTKKELKKLMQEEPWIDVGTMFGNGRIKENEPTKYHCPRCDERVYYPDNCKKCYQEIKWKGN